jgi:uncharacterized protein
LEPLLKVTEFTPLTSAFGGVLIGLSAVLFMLTHGRIAGISGIISRIFPPYNDEQFAGRAFFVIGIMGAPMMYKIISGSWPVLTLTATTPTLLISGLLVGFGSVLGSGCTSGHGVCGLARLSPRSLIAVIVFMATAVITVLLTRHLV